MSPHAYLNPVLVAALLLVFAAPVVALDLEGMTRDFPQETVTFFDTRHGLPADEVLGIALLEGNVPVALTAQGVSVWAHDTWEPVESTGSFSPKLISGHADGNVWVAGEHELAVLGSHGGLAAPALAGETILAIAADEDGVYVGTREGLLYVASRSVAKSPRRGLPRFKTDSPVLSVVVGEGMLYAGTETGLLKLPTKEAWKHAVVEKEFPSQVRAVTLAGNVVWASGEREVARLSDGKWSFIGGKEGLPLAGATSAAARGGHVWFGTRQGAVHYDGKHWFYRAGLRFLPDDHVNGVAVAEDGTAWLATNKGISRIERRTMTLAEKAKAYEEIIDKRHRRLGEYTVLCSFAEAGNVENFELEPTDNDGLYTAQYGASQCFRYAATKEPEAKERARRVLKALKLLYDVTGNPGFPARAVVPRDGQHVDPNIEFDEAFNLKNQEGDPLWKNILPRWPVSADGKYWWKCDTSSDEVSGHFSFFAVYHDLVCETDAERQEVAAMTNALATHIVDHDFTLIDHDGKPTRWANWSPEYVNGLDGWMDRGLQSTEILSFLNVALHQTGDQKYAKAARKLRDEHQYHMNALRSRSAWPPPTVVPWDNNLAFLAFYGLINYEQDPELKRLYRMAMDYAWTHAARQNDPFFNFTYLSLMPETRSDFTSENADLPGERAWAHAKAVETLVRVPQLLINYHMKNSHRLDVYNDPSLRRGKPYGWMLATGDAVPIEERSHIRLDSDHFDLDIATTNRLGRGNGTIEYEGSFFLLPYYMGLHYGFIGKGK